MNAEFLLIIAIGIVGFIVQAKLQSVFKKYSKVMFPGGLTGRDVAERMLHDNGIYDVKVVSTPGHLTDHYNPATKTVNASNSVAAAAVAAHECGHAVQHAKEYAPLKLRSALVPVVNFTSNAWMIVFFLGIAMGAAGLTRFAIALFAFSVIFQIVTLPVEFDASRRAVAYVERSGLGPQAVRGAKKVLVAAALTYVAAALVSVLQLLYYLSKTDRRGER